MSSASTAALQPESKLRRSNIYRVLRASGANFVELCDAAVVSDFGNIGTEVERAKRMGLADLSPLPRFGFKGNGTAEWLASQGLEVPADSNRATGQSDGGLALRLAPREIVVLGDVRGQNGMPQRLQDAWNSEPLPPPSPRGFPMPRNETHAWFLVTGSESAKMFAKICAVDLRPDYFSNGSIAQTSFARSNGIAVRDDQGEILAYHFLMDCASAEYMWGCLLDAMAEFDGGPVGLEAIWKLKA
jgi:sarcosine oxidase subunit gamma